MTTNQKNVSNGQSEKDRPAPLPAKQRQPLSHRDAEAASPEDCSVCGEEDPGSALESLVNSD
jgi:hypothetical protein